MDNIKLFKEQQINKYISDYLSDKPEFIDIEKIINDIGNVIHEKPAVKLNYIKEEILNEASGEKEDIESVESITVIFTYTQEVNGIDIPFPVIQKFIIG